MMANTSPFRVLFVCLGNICRSPSAESIFNKLIKDAGLQGRIECESAGTSGYHEGATADARMRKHGEKRGYEFLTRARQITPSDIFDFDLIVTMDRRNFADVQRLVKDDVLLTKVVEMADFSKDESFYEVPDPYFGGDAGFELVLDLLEDACSGLLAKIKVKLGSH